MHPLQQKHGVLTAGLPGKSLTLIFKINSCHVYTTVCKINSWWEAAIYSSVMTWVGGMGVVRREVQEGGDLCIHRADWLDSTAETNTTVYSSYTPIIEIK